jgi:hypothetical protein
MLQPPNPGPQSPIPGSTSQPNFAPLASRASPETQAVMGVSMQELWASMHTHSPRHENRHSHQHTSQNETPPPHRCRPQGNPWNQSGALPQVMLVCTPVSTNPNRSGHHGEAPQQTEGSCCTQPYLPHTQSLSTRPAPSCPRVSTLAANAHKSGASCGFGRDAL